ncbi:Dam family site-specific DNA-(adenine-N6)-methyltransferase [Daejeonella sp. H1SJ63]|uniref:DNA adenine methylase n=1 Tax=Daejeonella sp. H1SJ63 TaxID=3034145 RepID=UPI0023ED4493|nr:Dam family site-specific DNA-(adenine-N6)-methyltransferase [Daejeonella sp. H1SJ63]
MKEKLTVAKPFLRWAGGKSWLTKHIANFLPSKGFVKYHEPFVGGGSIYFHLHPNKAIISDLNEELIGTYLQVQNNIDQVIKELRQYENTEECYYQLRNTQVQSEVEKAARFIFLNQTSFNGIYRVNLKGEYNVPYGYRNKDFLDEANLTAASLVLQGRKIVHNDFHSSLKAVGKGDLVFIDPPYTVTHNNNGFIKYNKKLFDLESQIRLSEYIDEIKDRGAYYILTNADHHEIERIFHKEGDQIFRMNRASLIGGKNAIRGQYSELIITNSTL